MSTFNLIKYRFPPVPFSLLSCIDLPDSSVGLSLTRKDEFSLKGGLQFYCNLLINKTQTQKRQIQILSITVIFACKNIQSVVNNFYSTYYTVINDLDCEENYSWKTNF